MPLAPMRGHPLSLSLSQGELLLAWGRVGRLDFLLTPIASSAPSSILSIHPQPHRGRNLGEGRKEGRGATAGGRRRRHPHHRSLRGRHRNGSLTNESIAIPFVIQGSPLTKAPLLGMAKTVTAYRDRLKGVQI